MGKVPVGVRISSHSVIAQGASKDISGQGQSGIDSPSLATEELVHSNSQHVGGSTTTASSVAKFTSTRQSLSSQSSGVQLGCMESQRCTLRSQGFSEKVVDTMLQARKKSTQSCYDAGWLRFSRWCHQRAIDPTLATVPIICDFLQSLLDDGFQYTTLTGYVSAISLAHSEFSQGSLGQVREISQFLKVFLELRPPVKTLVPRWDLSIVLKAFMEFPYEPADAASLQAWTWKIVFLVAITSAARVSEFQALVSRQELLRTTDRSVTLRTNPAFMPKVPRAEYVSRQIELQSFDPDTLGVQANFALLCPVRAAKVYLQKVLKCEEKS